MFWLIRDNFAIIAAGHWARVGTGEVATATATAGRGRAASRGGARAHARVAGRVMASIVQAIRADRVRHLRPSLVGAGRYDGGQILGRARLVDLVGYIEGKQHEEEDAHREAEDVAVILQSIQRVVVDEAHGDQADQHQEDDYACGVVWVDKAEMSVLSDRQVQTDMAALEGETHTHTHTYHRQ